MVPTYAIPIYDRFCTQTTMYGVKKINHIILFVCFFLSFCLSFFRDVLYPRGPDVRMVDIFPPGIVREAPLHPANGECMVAARREEALQEIGCNGRLYILASDTPVLYTQAEFWDVIGTKVF
jgi:hypothetical protein